MNKKKYSITEERHIKDAINACPTSMLGASKIAKLPYGTFKYRAQKYGLYKPNQGGKGVKRPNNRGRKQLEFDIIDIINGKHPQYSTNILKKRLLREHIKENKCDKCGIEEWLGEPIVIELDHIDGDNSNHLLKNLRMLCPNCHSQTANYRGRNKKKSTKITVSDIDLITALKETSNIRQALITVGLIPKGANYKRAKRLKFLIEQL